MPWRPCRPNDGDVTKRYDVVLAGSSLDACTHVPGASGLAGVGDHLA
jgi:hypothetical protein